EIGMTRRWRRDHLHAIERRVRALHVILPRQKRDVYARLFRQKRIKRLTMGFDASRHARNPPGAKHANFQATGHSSPFSPCCTTWFCFSGVFSQAGASAAITARSSYWGRQSVFEQIAAQSATISPISRGRRGEYLSGREPPWARATALTT